MLALVHHRRENVVFVVFVVSMSCTCRVYVVTITLNVVRMS